MVLIEDRHLRTGVVADDRALRAVEQAAHRVVALAGDAAKHLADHVARVFQHGDRGIVGGPVLQHLVVGVGKHLIRPAGDPAEQIHRVAAAAQQTVAHRVDTPVVRAANLQVVVRVFAFHIVQFADFARVDQFLRLGERRSVAADLADHQLFAGGFRCGDHVCAGFAGQRHRFFAQYVLAVLQRRNRHFLVKLVGRAHDHHIDIVGQRNFLPRFRDAQGMTVANDGGHGLGIRIKNSCELALYLRGDALRVIRAHAQTNDAITDFFHLSSLLWVCFR